MEGYIHTIIEENKRLNCQQRIAYKSFYFSKNKKVSLIVIRTWVRTIVVHIKATRHRCAKPCCKGGKSTPRFLFVTLFLRNRSYCLKAMQGCVIAEALQNPGKFFWTVPKKLYFLFKNNFRNSKHEAIFRNIGCECVFFGKFSEVD